SSRRRHTRSKRDWSSDVCSSDLLLFGVWLLRDRAPLLLGHPCISTRGPLEGEPAQPQPCHVGVCRVFCGDCPPHLALLLHCAAEIGRASCRERVSIWGVCGSVSE